MTEHLKKMSPNKGSGDLSQITREKEEAELIRKYENCLVQLSNKDT